MVLHFIINPPPPPSISVYTWAAVMITMCTPYVAEQGILLWQLVLIMFGRWQLCLMLIYLFIYLFGVLRRF